MRTEKRHRIVAAWWPTVLLSFCLGLVPVEPSMAALPPPEPEDTVAESVELVLADVAGKVSERLRGSLAAGSPLPGEALRATPRRPAVVGRTRNGTWWSAPVYRGGLVTMHPPGSGSQPAAITVTQLRGLASSGRLPPFRVQVRLRFPLDEGGDGGQDAGVARRELLVSWEDARTGGPVRIDGLGRGAAAAPLAGAGAYIHGESLLFDIKLRSDLTIYLYGHVESVAGGTVRATMVVRDPPLLAAAELDSLLAGGQPSRRTLTGRVTFTRPVPGLTIPPGRSTAEPLAVTLAATAHVSMRSTLSGVAKAPLEYFNQLDLEAGRAYQFRLGGDALELLLPKAATDKLDRLLGALDWPLVLAVAGTLRGPVRLRKGGYENFKGGKVVEVGHFELWLAR